MKAYHYRNPKITKEDSKRDNRSKRIMKVLVAQSCLTLWNPRTYLPGSSVHGIHQTRILEWIAIPFSRGSSWPRDWTQVSCIAGIFFTVWANREALLLFPQSQITCVFRCNFILQKSSELSLMTIFLSMRRKKYCREALLEAIRVNNE